MMCIQQHYQARHNIKISDDVVTALQHYPCDSAEKIAGLIERFLTAMNRSEVLWLIPWYESIPDEHALLFAVVDRQQSASHRCRLLISFHLNDNRFYSDSSNFKHYSVHKNWESFAKTLLDCQADAS